MMIVGDTHGQLADVLWIFAEYGLPSKENAYLFNGDVADRGSYAVEIYALLFCFMLKEPGSVYLSRGNHENMEINERAQQYGGGFAEEVRRKYDNETFSLFTELFEMLPLARTSRCECDIAMLTVMRYSTPGKRLPRSISLQGWE